jgi:signal transduction histidine kinase
VAAWRTYSADMSWLRLLSSLLTGVLLVVAGWLTVLAPTTTMLGFFTLGLFIAPTSAVLGLVVGRRQPRNIVGLILTLLGLAVAFMIVRQGIWEALGAHPGQIPRFTELVAVLNESAWWTFAAVALLLVYFPDGTLPSRRWRWVPLTLVVCVALQQARGAFPGDSVSAPLQQVVQPFGTLPRWLDIAQGLTFFLMLSLILACAGSLVLRYRRSDRVRRAQIKWLAFAGLGFPLYPPLCLVEIGVLGHPAWFSVAVGLAGLAGIPLATGIAMLRYDLYDVDRALAGTVTWSFITIVLLGLYGASSLTVGLLFGRGSSVAAAAATAVGAIALSPLRSRLQRAVDRRLYPLRRAAGSAIDALHRDTGTGAARPEELQAVLRIALRDPGLRVGFHVPGTDGFIDAEGVAVPPTGTPVVLSETRIGVVVAGTGDASPELLRYVADRAGTLVEVVRLRLELAGALREVESSRARLVQSGYRERRRLERDLHDGAQQRLVSLGMTLRLAQRHLDDGTVDVNGVLDQGVAELSTAVAELRQIAHGLRPSSLDDGLPAALAALVRTVPVLVEMDICPDRLPDDVATTAYYVVSEAVANAVKHAEAKCISLGVARADGQVLVRVSDDGRGGATLQARSSLADRVAALGGRLKIESPVGRGTLVEAALPCAL